MPPKFSSSNKFGRGKCSRHKQLRLARENKNKSIAPAAASLDGNDAEEGAVGSTETMPGTSNTVQSASSRKLSSSFDDTNRRTMDADNNCNFIVTDVQLDLLVRQLCCPQCLQPTLKGRYSNLFGLVANMEVFCTSCDQVVAVESTSAVSRPNSDEKTL